MVSPRALKNTLSGCVTDTSVPPASITIASAMDRPVCSTGVAPGSASHAMALGGSGGQTGRRPRRGPSSMATSLKDIPGANRARKPRRSERGLWAPSRSTKLDLTPGSLRLSRPEQTRVQALDPPDRPLPRGPRARARSASSVWLAMAFWGATRVHVVATGIDDGRALTPEAAEELDITIALDSSDELFRAELKVDGVPLLEDLEPEADGRSVRIRPADLVESELVEQALAEGEHKIELSVGRMFLGDSTFTWSYVVDSIAPTLDLPTSLDPVPIADAVTVRAPSRTAPSCASAARRSTSTTERSRWTSTPRPPAPSSSPPIDEAGNETTAHVVVPVDLPRHAREQST